MNKSLMNVTALNPHIGYENAAKVAKTAFEEDLTLKDAAVKLGFVTEQTYEEYVNLAKMTKPNLE